MINKAYLVLEYNENLDEILQDYPDYKKKEIFKFQGKSYITLISKKYSLELKRETEILEIKLSIFFL